MWRKSASQTHNQAARHFALQLRLRSNWISWEVHQFYDFTRSIRRRARAVCQNILEVALFLRNRGSQCLFWGNRATRIGGSIPEESRFTIPVFGGIVPPLTSTSLKWYPSSCRAGRKRLAPKPPPKRQPDPKQVTSTRSRIRRQAAAAAARAHERDDDLESTAATTVSAATGVRHGCIIFTFYLLHF